MYYIISNIRLNNGFDEAFALTLTEIIIIKYALRNKHILNMFISYFFY